MATKFDKIIKQHQECVELIVKDSNFENLVSEVIKCLVHCYQNRGKVLFCGNGGSAADAEHLAGELSGRFKFNRAPLNAEALHVNSAALTAISNDFSYEEAFARILESKANQNDVLIAITTSGTSKNVLRAMKKAKDLKMKTVVFCGENDSSVSELADIVIRIPSNETPRIQEVYMLIGHIICEEVEHILFNSEA